MTIKKILLTLSIWECILASLCVIVIAVYQLEILPFTVLALCFCVMLFFSMNCSVVGLAILNIHILQTKRKAEKKIAFEFFSVQLTITILVLAMLFYVQSYNLKHLPAFLVVLFLSGFLNIQKLYIITKYILETIHTKYDEKKNYITK